MMKIALVLALIAAPAYANETKRDAVCSVNGRVSDCKLDILMSMGSRFVTVTMRNGRVFEVQNKALRGHLLSDFDLQENEVVWLMNGQIVKRSWPDGSPGLTCYATRRVKLCGPF
jgi:hypothetical protein